MLWLLGDRAYDAICSMRCPQCILVGGSWIGSIWNDGVEVSILCVDQVKLLGFQYGSFFGLWTFRCDVLCYGWEQGFEKPIQEDHVIKLDFAQNTMSPPLMDVVDYMCCSALAAG